MKKDYNLSYSIVVIGGGSAGMASAIEAWDNGVKNILILEKESHLGGILLQCIHNGFGLHTFKEELTGPEYASRFEKEVLNRNIDYKLSSVVLKIEKYNDEFLVHYSNSQDGYVIVKAKAIISATGCSERTRGAIGIPGDRSSGVMTAGLAQKYLNIEGYMVGKRVFILGSGDIGLIMARRMVLEGAKVLGVAEMMPYSNGLNRNIVQCLNDYNIPLYLHHTVKETVGKTRLEKVIIQELDDKFNFVPGTEKEFEVDTLLLSIGLIPSNPLLENLGVAIHPRTKGPIVNQYLETSIKGIFACGNGLHVHDLVDFVSSEGKVVGLNASKYVKGELDKEDINNKINIMNGNGVGYVMPSFTNKDVDNTKVSFRVSKPYKNVILNIKQGDNVIKSIKKPYMLPAEMENVIIDSKLLSNLDNITLEVIDG
ncbi:MAG: FAD-dependent oxidoreductase [Bacilli bacterium]|nr:FAD-dependent oxidoreductase [Bacilli bacterium]